MERSYTIEHGAGITTIRLHRRLDLEEILEVIDEVAASDISSRRLWDLTRNVRFTADEIRAIAARGREHWPGAARVAYLAADDLSFGLMRMFEVFREQENYETRVFRDEVEAREWLAEWSPIAESARSSGQSSAAATGAAEQIVADGMTSWWESAEGVARRHQIEAEVRARYETDLEIAGWFKRALLGLRIRREITAARAKATLEVLWAAADPPPEQDDSDS